MVSNTWLYAVFKILFYPLCGHGGIGRRVRFRFLWSQGCAGSSPVVRTKKRQSERVVFFHATADLKQNCVLSANGTAFVCPCTLCSWRNALQVNLLAYAITLAPLSTSPVVRTKANKNEPKLIGSFFHIFGLRQDLWQCSALSAHSVCPCTLCSWRFTYANKFARFAITLVLLATSPVVRTTQSLNRILYLSVWFRFVNLQKHFKTQQYML